ncbi:MAG: hypothetical protein K2M31_01110 [Muribaculaceae bacterium]|nr:hypothetical protein [Muribaculaceae bacterium]
MKKLLLLATAILGLGSANQAVAALPPSSVPSGVTVIPSPGSEIDVTSPEYTLGVSTITLSFGGREIYPNSKNTVPAELYKNDFSGAPVETTMRASVDMETMKTCGVIFSGAWTSNGQYKIVIPEGMFVYVSGTDANDEPTGTEPTPGMTLYYEINTPWYPTPVDQMVVPELQDIVLTFPGASEVRMTSKYKATFGTLTDYYGIASSVEGNRLIIKMSQSGGIASSFDIPGQYLLGIDPGSVEYVVDGVTKTNNEVRLTYHIHAAPEPSVYPYADEAVTDGIEYFEITAPDGFSDSFFLMNDRVNNYLYQANEMGDLDKTHPAALCKALWAECDVERHQIYLALYDPLTLEPLNFTLDQGTFFEPKPTDEWSVVPGSLQPWKPLYSGTYCLLLGQGLYSGEYTSQILGSTPKFIVSEPFRFYYEIEGQVTVGVDKIVNNAEVDSVNVYTLSGIRVLGNAQKSELKNLPAGFYVVNGKKVVVK